LEIPLGSSAGAPWPAGRQRDEGLVVQAYGIAKEILAAAAISQSALDLFKSKNPDLFVLRLKNKYEMMNIGDMQEKVRPYYVLPTHLLILFGAVVRPIEKAMRGFWEDPKSHSAYKFSWVGGGGDRLIAFADADGREGSFDWISFGDDQLWRFTVAGENFVVAPDVKGMDMCLGLNWVPGLLSFYLKAYAGKLSPAWMQILRLYAEMMTMAKVVIQGSVTVDKRAGWHSGASGITTSEMVVNNYFFEGKKAEVEKLLEDGKDLKTTEDKKKVVEAVVLKLASAGAACGIYFKPETLTVYGSDEAVEMEDSLGKVFVTPWKFLGYSVGTRLVQEETRRFPYAEPGKLFASACTPRVRAEGVVRLGKLKARAFGLYMVGGYQNRLVERTLRGVYRHYEVGGIRMGQLTEGVNGMAEYHRWRFSTDPTFPDAEKVEKLYSGEMSQSAFMELVGAVDRREYDVVEKLTTRTDMLDYAAEAKKKEKFKGKWGDVEREGLSELDNLVAGAGAGMTVPEGTVVGAPKPSAPVKDTSVGTAPHPVTAAKHDERHKATLMKGQLKKMPAEMKSRKGGKKMTSHGPNVQSIGEHMKELDKVAADHSAGSFKAPERPGDVEVSALAGSKGLDQFG